jgi:hypothetical protein
VNTDKAVKPLGTKAYGHIAHLPQSRMGPGDHKLHEGQGRILTEKARDRHDRIIVQEKLDGSNVAVARIDGNLVPLTRAGYPALSSPYIQHRYFFTWVFERTDLFDFLEDGDRVIGEWLAQAHGTRYQLMHEPFVAFDIMRGSVRLPFDEFNLRTSCLTKPYLIHDGGPMSVEAAMELLGTYGKHGATDPIEGAVWRCERRGAVDFLGKYVRPEKVDGCFLPEVCGTDHWNWRPE